MFYQDTQLEADVPFAPLIHRPIFIYAYLSTGSYTIAGMQTRILLGHVLLVYYLSLRS